jgi:hypothetical protein
VEYVHGSDRECVLQQLGRVVNQLCAATGQLPLDLSALKGTAVATTVAAISTATGTAADPGTTKARVDADLTVMANNVATMAARITAVVSGTNSLRSQPHRGFCNP